MDNIEEGILQQVYDFLIDTFPPTIFDYTGGVNIRWIEEDDDPVRLNSYYNSNLNYSSYTVNYCNIDCLWNKENSMTITVADNIYFYITVKERCDKYCINIENFTYYLNGLFFIEKNDWKNSLLRFILNNSIFFNETDFFI